MYEHAFNHEPRYQLRAWSLVGQPGIGRDASSRQSLTELLDHWHLTCVVYPMSRCAGCGKPLALRDMQSAAGRPRLHADAPDCAAAHERLWRQEGIKALRSTGLAIAQVVPEAVL